MSTLSTHVLDAVRGVPAAGIAVTLFGPDPAAAAGGAAPDPGAAPGDSAAVPTVGTAAVPPGNTAAVTDADGRIADLGEGLVPGVYRLRFETGGYFAERGVPAFYPEVTIAFTVGDESHYHVPLLLSPFAYSTYRGS
jgi:5-hydroxyisourate hydrolase